MRAELLDVMFRLVGGAMCIAAATALVFSTTDGLLLVLAAIVFLTGSKLVWDIFHRSAQ